MVINLSFFRRFFKYLLSILIITFIVSCSNTKHAFKEKTLPETKLSADANEVKLGDSKFYLTVPDNIKVIEARGKEGQHGFNILPKDDSLKFYGFIEIQHGVPIIDSNYDDCKDEKIYTKSIFLNEQVTWTICATENKYIDIKTKGYNGITAFAYADKKSDIDSLINIIGTLSEK